MFGATSLPPTIIATTPGAVEKGQTTIGTVTPGRGDTLTLKETAGAGTLSLGAVQNDGTQQVVYTAPAAVPASATDAVSYTIAENGLSVPGSANVQLDAGPSITPATPSAVGQGKTTVIGTVTPGLSGRRLTLKETAGSGTLSLGAVQTNGTQQVIYTAPASIPTSTTDTVTYTVSDQHNDAVASGGPETVPLVAAPATPPPSIKAPATATVNVGQASPISGVSLAETPTTSGETFTAVLTDTNGVLAATTSAKGGGGTITPVEWRQDADDQRHAGAGERRPHDADRHRRLDGIRYDHGQRPRQQRRERDASLDRRDGERRARQWKLYGRSIGVEQRRQARQRKQQGFRRTGCQ